MRKKSLVLLLIILLAGMTASFAQDLGVTVTAPAAGSKYTPCSNITLQADATVPDGVTIKEVRFFHSGSQYIKLDRSEPYEVEWSNVPDGYYVITARVTDNNNNQVFSDPVPIMVGNLENGDIIKNGEFNCSRSPWNLAAHQGASATWHIDPEVWLSDSTAAVVEVSEPGSADWHVQLSQALPIDSGHTYIVSFIADAPESKSISVMIQEGGDPYTTYSSTGFEIDGFADYGPIEFTSTVTDPSAKLIFNLGNNTTTIYIDAVQVIDPSVTAVEDSRVSGKMGDIRYLMSLNYPNPFNSTTKIHYSLPEDAHVTLQIFNVAGQKICTLVNADDTAGEHDVLWHGQNDLMEGVPSGMYIYQIKARTAKSTETVSQKMLLLE